MKIFGMRLFFILALVFFEFSFFDILFPQISAPLILIASAVAWVLVSGFPVALFMIVPLSVFFDIVSAGMPGVLTLYAVPFAYTTSFLSRRILAEHRGIGMVLYALYAGIGALGYIVFDFIFFQGGAFLGTPNRFFDFLTIFSFSKIFPLAIFIFPIFMGAYQIICYFERYINSISQRDFLRVK
jgi:hypothetical protein